MQFASVVMGLFCAVFKQSVDTVDGRRESIKYSSGKDGDYVVVLVVGSSDRYGESDQ